MVIDLDNGFDFTIIAENNFYDTVDAQTFHDEDAQQIFDHLQSRMQLIPFGDYLKRYIFTKAGFEGNLEDVPLKEYQCIIVDSFQENSTPKSFNETSTKFSALTKNWLTQTSVNRQVVFLLGFGLNMSVSDVSNFLVKVLRERDFNFKNPSEVVCWYCFVNGYKFPKYVQLMETYEKLPVGGELGGDLTIGVRDMFASVHNEEELISRLSLIKADNNGRFFSVTAKKNFDILYEKTKEIIAKCYSDDAQQQAWRDSVEYRDRVDNSTLLTIEEKNNRAAVIRNSAKTITPDDITESDVEKYLCCGVPFDKKGNLIKFNRSIFAKHFSSKRMSRQHINELLKNKVDIDRFDLITLCFFVHAMDDETDNNKRRYINIVNDVNRILVECNMGELYIANPYECFLLMCILSDCPMGTYADVLEKSFS